MFYKIEYRRNACRMSVWLVKPNGEDLCLGDLPYNQQNIEEVIDTLNTAARVCVSTLVFTGTPVQWISA